MKTYFFKGSKKGWCALKIGFSCAELMRAVALFMAGWMVSGSGLAAAPCMAVGVDSIVKVLSSSFEAYELPDSERAALNEDVKKKLERCLTSHVVCTLISDTQDHEMWSEQDDFEPTGLNTNYHGITLDYMIIQFAKPQFIEPLCMVVKSTSWFDTSWDVARWVVRPSGVRRLQDKHIACKKAETLDELLKVLRSRYEARIESTAIDTHDAL